MKMLSSDAFSESTLVRPIFQPPTITGKRKWKLGEVEIISTSEISESDLHDVWLLEQDAWAHGINEYRMCDSCWKVHSKDEIYEGMPEVVKKLPVGKLEEILWSPNIRCICCDGPTHPIYWKEYIECIRERYKDRAYLAVLREENEDAHTQGIWINRKRGRIKGFIDWYMWDFSTIYEREFQQYYGSSFTQEELKSYIEKKIWYKLPEQVLFWTALAMDERYKSMNNVYKLLKWFFGAMNPEEGIVCISEAAGGTNVCQIYLSMWAQAVGINDAISQDQLNGKASDMLSDIYVQEGIVPAYQEGLQSSRTFWRNVLAA